MLVVSFSSQSSPFLFEFLRLFFPKSLIKLYSWIKCTLAPDWFFGNKTHDYLGPNKWISIASNRSVRIIDLCYQSSLSSSHMSSAAQELGLLRAAQSMVVRDDLLSLGLFNVGCRTTRPSIKAFFIRLAQSPPG